MRVRFWVAVAVLGSLTWACAPAPKVSQTAPGAGLNTPEQAALVEAYRTWVLAQADDLLVRTTAFVSAVKSGNREKAQALYAPTRMPYERIEPIAEALGDLDPRIDARENDVKPADWSGFHMVEKVLWSTQPLKSVSAAAQTLLDDVKLLRARIETAEIKVHSLVTGAVELLNEVSTSKVTGEEERYSHSDLWDFQANVDGSAKIWELLAPATKAADPALASTLDERMEALNALLALHKKGEGFKLYTDLKPEEVKALSASVDALAEPLSKLGRLFPAE